MDAINDTSGKTQKGLIALLGLPKHFRLGLDGQVIVLQTNDFVGVRNVPSSGFHLITACSGVAEGNASNSLTVGFVIHDQDPVQLIRRYSPNTEEVSEDEVDHLTAKNLWNQIENQQIEPSRLLSYEQIVVPPSSSGQEFQSIVITWEDQTCYINQSNILLLRGIVSGDKIVPGSYDPDDELKSNPKTAVATATMDGKSIEYPPIPVINTNLSLATHKHSGTRRFLANFAPEQRTNLFVLDHQEMQQFILNHILHEYYQDSWIALLGDVQLSFCLFLHIHCLQSLEHWKDLVAMLALTSNSNYECKRYSNLFQGLLQILPYQLSSMDADFLEDMEEAGGNFLLPSLEMLQQNICLNNAVDEATADKFQHALVSKFPKTFSESGMRIQMLPNGAGEEDEEMHLDNSMDYDEDGPVVVDSDEIQASLARSAAALSENKHTINIPMEIRQGYPLLVAAIQPHEDIVMTCARALDEKTDVGLVREAAAYLEEVEQYKQAA
ncbi:AAR2 domain containing protein [Nitzschia inconspicua]|uniref:AAR2 domain containing protein n=1 Tax=Nitzschia inconspicua TaxID=303405 RepID=A0A9K3L2H6_9STRA|nr:AAR2 domain containing protein [Nitzschia inconspicua]